MHSYIWILCLHKSFISLKSQIKKGIHLKWWPLSQYWRKNSIKSQPIHWIETLQDHLKWQIEFKREKCHVWFIHLDWVHTSNQKSFYYIKRLFCQNCCEICRHLNVFCLNWEVFAKERSQSINRLNIIEQDKTRLVNNRIFELSQNVFKIPKQSHKWRNYFRFFL